nr:MAG TPA: hypothetical protein [Caudoviricetes sp.]DAR93932.1 MAG TPA: hypothetical protein [Caudoviricetes sp.]
MNTSHRSYILRDFAASVSSALAFSPCFLESLLWKYLPHFHG